MITNPEIAFFAAWVVTLCALGSDPGGRPTSSVGGEQLEESIIPPDPKNLSQPPVTSAFANRTSLPPPLAEGGLGRDRRLETGEAPDTGAGTSDDKKGNDAATATSQPKPGKLVVVVSRENPVDSLKLDELRRIFLRQDTNWKTGEPISVFERPSDSPIGRDFSQRVLKKTADELKTYWMELQVTKGMKPPKVLRSASLVKEYLQRVRSGVGYVHENEVDESVKIVKVLELEDAHEP